MEEWAEGGLMLDEQFGTALMNARGVAECAAFQMLLDVDLSQLNRRNDD